MVTSLNVDTALRQEELELEGEIEFETLVEIALREYILLYAANSQSISIASFGESQACIW
ncbi:hypothetical protein QUB47_34035 [Microcoleus sp. AT9_B5]